MLGGYKKEHHRAFRIWADSLDGTQVHFYCQRTVSTCTQKQNLPNHLHCQPRWSSSFWEG